MTAIADAQLEAIGVDVSKLTYTFMQPPDQQPPIYPKLEQPQTAQPVAAPVDPILLAQQYAAMHPQPSVSERQHRKRKKKKSLLGRLQDTALSIKNRLDAYVPEFVGFEDDDSDEEEEYAVDSIDRRQPTAQPTSSLQGEFSYGQRAKLPAATAPPMEDSRSFYQPITQPVAQPSTYTPPLAAGLYQKISSRYSAVKLRSEGVTVADLIAADVKLVDFRRAGYTLDEVHHLVPEYEFMLKLGADRALFDNKWRVSTLCELYRIPFATVCSSLKLNAGDLLRAGLGLDQVAATGLTLAQLIDLGADFEFIRAMRSSPYKVSSRLKATRYDLDRLNFSRAEKLQLQKELGWKTTSMIGAFGITAASAGEDWLPIPIESMIGNVSW